MRYLKELGTVITEPGLPFAPPRDGRPARRRVGIIACGDVGGMAAAGLRMLGGDVVASVGICDPDEKAAARYEAELNQIAYPLNGSAPEMPEVRAVPQKDIFRESDAVMFCATAGVPPVGASAGDVRLAQLEKNRAIAEMYARQAAEEGWGGLFAVVSDPVDQLCAAVCSCGLNAARVAGYGLGVMNARAAYHAKRDARFASYLKDGRAYGPHGAGLVIANSLSEYDEALSEELTKLAAEENLRVRAMGYKPFIAPAISSAAISMILTLRGEMHYSSLCVEDAGGRRAFLGMLNRLTPSGAEAEDVPIPDALFERIKRSYAELKED